MKVTLMAIVIGQSWKIHNFYILPERQNFHETKFRQTMKIHEKVKT